MSFHSESVPVIFPNFFSRKVIFLCRLKLFIKVKPIIWDFQDGFRKFDACICIENWDNNWRHWSYSLHLIVTDWIPQSREAKQWARDSYRTGIKYNFIQKQNLRFRVKLSYKIYFRNANFRNTLCYFWHMGFSQGSRKNWKSCFVSRLRLLRRGK